MAEATTEDDDDDDADDKAVSKVVPVGDGTAKQGSGTGKERGGPGRARRATTAVAAGAALTAGQQKGEGRGKDAAQAITPLLIRRVAQFAANILMPESWVQWIATRTRADKDTLDGIAGLFAYALDRANLLSEANQKELNDLVSDFSGALGERMRNLPTLKAAAAATALVVKERELAELLAQPAFAADVTDPNRPVVVHAASCYTIAAVVARNKTAKKGGTRAAIAEFTGYAVRAQNLDTNHACCGQLGRDYFGRVTAFEREIDRMRPQDFDVLIASPQGTAMLQALDALIPPDEMMTGRVTLPAGTVVRFPNGVIGCLRQSGFERADVTGLTEPGIDKATLVARLVVIRDRNTQQQAVEPPFTFRRAARDVIDVGGEVARHAVDAAKALNQRTGVGTGFQRAGDEMRSWADAIDERRRGFHNNDPATPATAAFAQAQVAFGGAAIVPPGGANPPMTRRQRAVGWVRRWGWAIALLIIVLIELWR